MKQPVRPPTAVRTLALAGVLGFALGAAAQEPPEEPQTEQKAAPVEVARARLKGPPGHRHVRGVRRFRAGGGRVDWSRQGTWIAFDQADTNGLYRVYIMPPDGVGEKCLTCEQQDFRKVNALSPVWHPSGEYLVIQVQRSAKRLKMDAVRLASSHRGLHSELWAITRDGRRAWQLTRVTDRGGAVVGPHFSHEADRLAWSQRLESTGQWGEWAPVVAEFDVKRGVPRLGKIRTYEPQVQKGFVVAHGFTPNDRGLLLSALPDPNLGESGRDVLRLDLETGDFERLSDTPDQRDDLIVPLPRGDGFVWVSDRGVEPPPEGRLPWRSDLWFMSSSGRQQERLTFFNHPRSGHFLGEALIDDLTWSPEGDRLLVHVVSASPGAEIEEAIYLLELDGLGG